MSSNIFILPHTYVFLHFQLPIPFFSWRASPSLLLLTLRTRIYSLFLFYVASHRSNTLERQHGPALLQRVHTRVGRRSSLEQPMTCSPCVSRNATSRPDCNGARPAGHFSSERAGVRDRARMREQSAAWAFGSGRWMPGLRR